MDGLTAKARKGADKSAPSPLLVAVDDGYAAIKVVAHAGPLGTPVEMLIPTTVKAGQEGITAFDAAVQGGVNTSGWYATGGQKFTVGEHLAGDETRFDGFHTSAMNRAAIHHALRVAGYGGREVDIVVGLPVADYYVDGGRNEALIAAKTKNLLEPVSAIVEARLGQNDDVTVKSVRVASQAVASWLDYALNQDLTIRDGVDVTAPIAVVDIGGRTTDIVVVLNGSMIDHGRSGTENVGVINVRSELAAAIRRKYDVSDLPAVLYDKAIRTGHIKMFGKSVDVRHELDEAVVATGERIATVMMRCIGRAADLGAVLFVGGGAPLFRHLADRYPHGVVADGAQYTNARGMLKYVRVKKGGE